MLSTKRRWQNIAQQHNTHHRQTVTATASNELHCAMCNQWNQVDDVMCTHPGVGQVTLLSTSGVFRSATSEERHTAVSSCHILHLPLVTCCRRQCAIFMVYLKMFNTITVSSKHVHKRSHTLINANLLLQKSCNQRICSPLGHWVTILWNCQHRLCQCRSCCRWL